MTEMEISDPRLPEYFWQRIRLEPRTGCWRWTGMLHQRGGYGRAFIQGASQRIQMAHRVSYIALHGPIPAGLEIDHLCRNHACCNPAHLEAVPHRENVRRGRAGDVVRRRQESKTHCPHGHAYDDANTYHYVTKRGGRARQCRTCARSRRIARQFARLAPVSL